MPHVLVAGKIHQKGIDLLRARSDFSFVLAEDPPDESYIPFIGDVDALIIRTQPLPQDVIAAAENLKIVSRHGVGCDAVDVSALTARGIPLCVVGDVNSAGVAEHAIALMLAASHLAIRADRAVRAGAWEWRSKAEASEIGGKNLLILGYGRIGRRVAELAGAFHMNVRAYDPYLLEQGWPDGQVVPEVDLHRGLAWADVVSVNMPKVEKPILAGPEFEVMKSSAVLVNTSRGGIVDEHALCIALKAGGIFAAALDVFDEEPPNPQNALFFLDNVIVSPHIAGVTREGAERLSVQSVQNVIDFFDGRLDRSLVVNKVQ